MIFSDIRYYYQRAGLACFMDFGLWCIVLYRWGSFMFSWKYRKLNPFWYIYLIMYQFQIFFLKVELPASVTIGRNLFLPHPYGLVMGGNAVIKNNVKIGPWTVIGHNFDRKNPVIEDGVYIGPHSCILGGIRIGKDSIIGAGAIVAKDVPEGSKVILKGTEVRVEKNTEPAQSEELNKQHTNAE